MKVVKCWGMLIICFMWILVSIIYSFAIGILSILSIIMTILCLLASYDSYKRYKCYLILDEKYISINEGIINGFNTIQLAEVEDIRIENNKVYIVLYGNKRKVIYLNLFDTENRNTTLEYIRSL